MYAAYGVTMTMQCAACVGVVTSGGIVWQAASITKPDAVSIALAVTAMAVAVRRINVINIKRRQLALSAK